MPEGHALEMCYQDNKRDANGSRASELAPVAILSVGFGLVALKLSGWMVVY